MFILTKSYTFEASHQLKYHDGKCANLHGHSYTLVVEICSEKLHESGPQTNMVMDFGVISKVVKRLVASHLDHHHLNDTLNTDSPTAEFIAQWTFNYLKPSLPALTAVTIKETATSSATYRPFPWYPYPNPSHQQQPECNHGQPYPSFHPLHVKAKEPDCNLSMNMKSSNPTPTNGHSITNGTHAMTNGR